MQRRRLVGLGLGLGLCLWLLPLAVPAAGETGPITVFAAASLTDVLQELGGAYAQVSGTKVEYSFAASSVLARQIEGGAHADAFFSADQEWMDYLDQRGLIQKPTRRDIVGNHLALVAPTGAGDAPRLDLAALADAPSQGDCVLVVHGHDLLLAEVAVATAGWVERSTPFAVRARFALGARHGCPFCSGSGDGIA